MYSIHIHVHVYALNADYALVQEENRLQELRLLLAAKQRFATVHGAIVIGDMAFLLIGSVHCCSQLGSVERSTAPPARCWLWGSS